MFNVTNFVVSQVNPHVVPFINKSAHGTLASFNKPFGAFSTPICKHGKYAFFDAVRMYPFLVADSKPGGCSRFLYSFEQYIRFNRLFFFVVSLHVYLMHPFLYLFSCYSRSH